MEYLVGQCRVTCPVRPFLQERPFMTPHLQHLKGLLITLAAIAIFVNLGLFLHSIPVVISVKLLTLCVISIGADSVCQIRSQLQKNAVT